MTEIKKCIECELEKPIADFSKNSKSISYTYCKICSSKLKNNTLQSLFYTSRKYGISVKNLQLLLSSQDNKCKICKRELVFETKFRENRACVDHIEGTLSIRGILCSECNIAIGLLKHDANILLSAIDYLHSNIVFEGTKDLFIRRNKKRNNTSNYLGVTFDRSKGKFKAKLALLGKSINIGYYQHPEEAAIAYNEYVKNNVSDYDHFINLNIIPENWKQIREEEAKLNLKKTKYIPKLEAEI